MAIKSLITIQLGLRVSKEKSGDGGRFKFRSAEDIFEKVKPLLSEAKAAVIVTDKIIEVGGKFAILSTASLIDEDGQVASADGIAIMDSHIVIGRAKDGSEYQKKTMSNEQCTGSASSYARKYALCGLFAIDNDENDPDQPNIQQTQQSTKQTNQGTSQKPKEEPLNHDEIAAYMAICADIDASENLDQIKANAARAKGTRYSKKVNDHAIKIAKEKGWYTPAK